MGIAGQPRPGDIGAVQVRVGHLRKHPSYEVVAQPGHVACVPRLGVHRCGHCGRQARDGGDVERAAADVTLLTAPVQEGLHAEVTPCHEGTHSVGATQLVSGEGQRVDA